MFSPQLFLVIPETQVIFAFTSGQGESRPDPVRPRPEDCREFNDIPECNTLKNVCEFNNGLNVPYMEKMGLGNIQEFKGINKDKEVVNNSLNVVAIDGFRMGWVSNSLSVASNNFKAVIPGKTLNEVNNLFKFS